MDDLPQTIYSPAESRPFVPDEFLLQFLSHELRDELKNTISKQRLDMVNQKKRRSNAEIVEFIETKIQEFEAYVKDELDQDRKEQALLQQQADEQAAVLTDSASNSVSSTGTSTPIYEQKKEFDSQSLSPRSKSEQDTFVGRRISLSRNPGATNTGKAPLRSNLIKKPSSRSNSDSNSTSDAEPGVSDGRVSGHSDDQEFGSERHERQVSFSLHPDTVYFISDDQPTTLYSSDDMPEDGPSSSSSGSLESNVVGFNIDNVNHQQDNSDNNGSADSDDTDADSDSPLRMYAGIQNLQDREVDMTVETDPGLDDWPTMPSVSDFQPDTTSNFENFGDDFIEDISSVSSSNDSPSPKSNNTGVSGSHYDSIDPKADPTSDHIQSSELQFPLISHSESSFPSSFADDKYPVSHSQKAAADNKGANGNRNSNKTSNIHENDQQEEDDENVFEFDEAFESSPGAKETNSQSPPGLPAELDQSLASILKESVVDPALSSSLPVSSLFSGSFKPRSTIKYLDVHPSKELPPDSDSDSSSSDDDNDNHAKERAFERGSFINRGKPLSASSEIAGSLPIQIVMPAGSIKRASVPDSMLEDDSSLNTNGDTSVQISARYGDIYPEDEKKYFSPSRDILSMSLSERLKLQKIQGDSDNSN